MEAEAHPEPMEEAPTRLDTVVEIVNDYLTRYTPLELFGYGFAYCALLFLLLPRIAYGLTSLSLLLIVVDGIQFYQANWAHTTITSQAAILLLLTTVIIAQIIATAKMFGIFH